MRRQWALIMPQCSFMGQQLSTSLVTSRGRLLSRLKTTNSPLATLFAPVCLTLVDAFETTLDYERHFPKLLQPMTTLFMTGQVFLSGGVCFHHRNCALGLAFPPPFQSLCKCAILSHCDCVRCTQIPIEFPPLDPRHSIAYTSTLQRFVTWIGRVFCYPSSHISPEMSHFVLICNNFSLRT